jgi:hypothetical protein
VEEIRTAYFPDTLGILDNLKEPPQYIRATGNSMMVPMTLEGLNNLKGYTVVGLLDSGATNRFMSQRFVDEHGIEVEPLAVVVLVYNANSSLNKGGHITHVVRMWLRMQDHAKIFLFTVTDTGKSDIIIRFNWLKQHNLEIDQQKQTIHFTDAQLPANEPGYRKSGRKRTMPT